MESTVSSPESAALEALKAKINDPNCPTLELARALQTHLTIYPQGHRVLADKLGIPEKRPYITEVIGLFKLPVADLAPLEGKVLSRRDIQKLQSRIRVSEPPVNHENQGVNQPVNHVNQPVNHENQDVNQPVNHPINRVDRVKSPINPDIKGIAWSIGKDMLRWTFWWMGPETRDRT